MVKKHLKIKLNRALALAIASVMALSNPVFATGTDAVKTSNYVISKLDEARTELEKIAKDRSIAAVIYLKDAYTLKAEADHYSEAVITVASGQSVSILSVDVDAGRNIWYQVSYTYSERTVLGYVEREFLASSDARFLSWEENYITTKNREAVWSVTDCSDIEAFPESYRDALYELRKAHPNWKFVRQEVGLNWSDVISAQTGDRSLISSSADSSYKGNLYGSGWYYATPGIISYYMDPRNFLSENTIFMFEQETFNSTTHTTESVQKVLNGTFMSGGIPGTNESYAATFVRIGEAYNMSPIALASRAKQEQGVNGTSPLISGNYPGYEGLYNYFNVKASGKTNEQIYINGLSYARTQGWNTRIKSLEGGSKVIASNYVGRGQDTLYLQKFDVDASDGTLYTHQYMQNIAAPYSEAVSTYKAYKNAGMVDTPFVFKIPVYNNMPKGKCIKPNATDEIGLNVSNVENLPVDQNAVLISLINGGQNTDVPMTYTSSDEKIATVDGNGVITGIKPGNVTISVKRTENTTNTAVCSVNVIKADIALSKIVMPDIEIEYAPDKTLSDIELPDGFSWADESLIPTVDNEGYSVVYNPDNSKYNAMTLLMPVTVSKAKTETDDIKLPSDLTVEAGGDISGISLPEGFVWVDDTLVAPKKTGTINCKAYYCADPTSYEQKEVDIKVTVVCTNHEYGEWEGKHADCEHDGTLTRKCSICGHEDKLLEEHIGHDYESAVTIEPTDLKDGVRTYVCKNCNDTYEEVIPAHKEQHKHNYVASITEKAGCLTNGVMTYTCSCKDTYTETIAPLGHDYDGNHVCKRCGYELPVVPQHIHDYSLNKCTATCTKDGENIYTCGCGDSYSEFAPKTGHSIKDGKCEKCDYIEPTATPTAAPTEAPKATPTAVPTEAPKATPTAAPTEAPKATPTAVPTAVPTEAPKADNSDNNRTTRTTVKPRDDSSKTSPEQSGDDSNNESPISIVMMSTTVLNEEKIEEYISESNKKFEITMANDVVWGVDLSNVDDYSDIDVDLTVNLDAVGIPQQLIDECAGENAYIQIELEHDGQFGFPVTMKIPSASENAGKVANLFWYNPSTGLMEYVTEGIVDENGYASFVMEHASRYIIAYADESLNPILLKTAEKISDDSDEPKEELGEPVIGAIDSQPEPGDYKFDVILLYGAIAIALILIIAVSVGVAIKKKNKEDDYYYDEED